MNHHSTHWDLWVRLTHWLVALLFFYNSFISEEGSSAHRYAGYLLIAAVVSRLVWGLIAPAPARLSSFKPSWPALKQHLNELWFHQRDDSIGHNPAGAIMVWVLWSLLLLTGISGYASRTDWLFGEDWIEELHEVLANATLFAAFAHIAAVFVMTKLTKHAYLKGMIFGRRD